jgi:hypothetical protein
MVRVNAAVRDRDLDLALEACEQHGGPVARVLQAALLRLPYGRQAVEAAFAEASLLEEQSLTRGLRPLATIAQVAPLLGLLGTVTGMIIAFGEISASGHRQPRAAGRRHRAGPGDDGGRPDRRDPRADRSELPREPRRRDPDRDRSAPRGAHGQRRAGGGRRKEPAASGPRRGASARRIAGPPAPAPTASARRLPAQPGRPSRTPSAVAEPIGRGPGGLAPAGPSPVRPRPVRVSSPVPWIPSFTSTTTAPVLGRGGRLRVERFAADGRPAACAWWRYGSDAGVA